jgi:hypothetical protein
MKKNYLKLRLNLINIRAKGKYDLKQKYEYVAVTFKIDDELKGENIKMHYY